MWARWTTQSSWGIVQNEDSGWRVCVMVWLYPYRCNQMISFEMTHNSLFVPQESQATQYIIKPLPIATVRLKIDSICMNSSHCISCLLVILVRSTTLLNFCYATLWPFGGHNSVNFFSLPVYSLCRKAVQVDTALSPRKRDNKQTMRKR